MKLSNQIGTLTDPFQVGSGSGLYCMYSCLHLIEEMVVHLGSRRFWFGLVWFGF